MGLTKKHNILQLYREMIHARSERDRMLVEERLYSAINENDEWAMRNFQWGEQPQVTAAGGGGVPAPAVRKSVLLDFDYLHDEVTPDFHAIQFGAPVDWVAERSTKMMVYDATITGIGCVMTIEPRNGGVPTTHSARCHATTPITIYAGEMLGLNIGWVTAAGADQGKFVVQAIRYKEETTNPLPSQIVNQVKVQEIPYTSLRAVMDSTYVADYADTGVRFYGEFTIWQ